MTTCNHGNTNNGATFCVCSWAWCRRREAGLRGKVTGWVSSGPLTSLKASPSLMSLESGRNQNLILGGAVRTRSHLAADGLRCTPAKQLTKCLFVLSRNPEGHRVSRSLPAGDAAANKNPGQRGLSLPEHLCSTGKIPWVTPTHLCTNCSQSMNVLSWKNVPMNKLCPHKP